MIGESKNGIIASTFLPISKMDFEQVCNSIFQTTDFSYEQWFRNNLYPACPCPGCNETYCSKFVDSFSASERIGLISSLISRLNSEIDVGASTNEGLDVVMLLCDWNFWQETTFHIYFPLFAEPLGRQLGKMKGMEVELDEFCRDPLKYYLKAAELGVSPRVLEHFQSTSLSTAADLINAAPTFFGGCLGEIVKKEEKRRKPRRKAKPLVDTTKSFKERWNSFCDSAFALPHHYFDLRVDYDDLVNEISKHDLKNDIVSNFPTGRGCLKWKRLKKKLATAK